MKFYYTYIMKSLKDGNLYVGSTDDIQTRYKQHQDGLVISTKHRRPIRLVCYEAYLTRAEAVRRERFLKSSDGRKDLRLRLSKTLE